MKLITFIAADGSEHVGAIVGDGARVADLTLAQGSQDGFRDMLCLIDAGPAGLEAAQRLAKGARNTLALADLRLQAPIPVPRRLRDFLSFELHVRQSRANRHLFGIGDYRFGTPLPQLPRREWTYSSDDADVLILIAAAPAVVVVAVAKDIT